MIWIKRILPSPALNSRKWDTASSSALAGNICFYSSLNTRLFPKSQEVDRSLKFLSLSQRRSRLYAGISSVLACHPKLTPAPGDLEAPLEETQRDSSVCRAGGTELPRGPLVAVHGVMGPEHPFLPEARLTRQLTTLQGSRFHKVDSELCEILPQHLSSCYFLLTGSRHPACFAHILPKMCRNSLALDSELADITKPIFHSLQISWADVLWIWSALC